MSRGGFEYTNTDTHSSHSSRNSHHSSRRSPPPNPSSPPPPLPQEPRTPKSHGWAQTATSPIGLLEETGDISPETGSPGSKRSVDLAVHRPIAQRLEHVYPDIPEAMSAVIYDDGNDWESVYSTNTPQINHRSSQARFEVNLKDEEYPESSYGPSEEEEALDELYEQHMKSRESEHSLFPPPSQENQNLQAQRLPHQKHQQSLSFETQYDEYTNDDNQFDNSQFIDDAPQHHWHREGHHEGNHEGHHDHAHTEDQYQEYMDDDNQFDDSQFVDTPHRGFVPSRNSSFGMMETHRDSRFPDQFRYVAPANIHVSQENDPDAVYYPAPVPAQLKLPPILSHRNKNKAQLPTRKPRPKSMLRMGIPLEQEWKPSPIDHEIAFQPEDESDIDSLLVESDASSYATRNSDDNASYQAEYDSDDDYSVHQRRQRSKNQNRALAKKEGWLSSTLYAIIGKSGDQDSKDAELVADQEDVQDEFNSTAFMKYDPDLVRQEAKRFESGGVYSGTHSGKKPTSLIEELEIRKQGRARQKKGIVRDAMAAQQQLATQNKYAHPLDKSQQPTLLQLQQVANVDYNDRKRWHQEATVRQKQDRGDESLAQRRARRKAAKAPHQGVGQEQPATETLAERRARIKAEKQHRSELIVQHSVPDSPAFGSPVPDTDSAPMTPAIGTA